MNDENDVSVCLWPARVQTNNAHCTLTLLFTLNFVIRIRNSLRYLFSGSLILVTGGEDYDRYYKYAELVDIEKKQACSLPSLPKASYGHTQVKFDITRISGLVNY